MAASSKFSRLVHGPEQISVPSGWAKLGNVFYAHICPVHYLSHDRPLNLAAFMWLSSIFNILFSKNSIFVFFDDFQIIFKLRPSSMTVLVKYNCSNTSWYPFELYVSISLKKMLKLWEIHAKIPSISQPMENMNSLSALNIKVIKPKVCQKLQHGQLHQVISTYCWYSYFFSCHVIMNHQKLPLPPK